MFGGKDMSKMMKQMGMDVEEIDADRVTVEVGDNKMVFDSPSVTKVDAQGKEVFQLQGDYSYESSGPSEDDIELVMQKADCSEEEAREALKENDGDIAASVMSLQ